MRIVWISALLMLAAACVDRSTTPTVPAALEVGQNRTVFAATMRAKDKNGHYGFERADRMSLLELTVSIPPTHTPGDLQFAYSEPDPTTQFTMAGRQEYETADAFRTRLRAELRGLPRGQREITVFVHGYNATQAETAFRAAQLAHDIKLPGATLIYSWPSRGKPLGYAYDHDSMLFARDGLETLLLGLTNTGAERVVLVAHSLGSALVMEAMRGIEISNPGWSARTLAGVVLISPDVNVELFREQVARISPLPQPFVIFVSNKDRALSLSSRLRGDKARLGNIDNIQELADLPLEIVDTSAFSSNAGSSHFVPATSPALIALMNDARSINDTFDSERQTLQNYLTGNVIDIQQVTRIVLTPAEIGAR